MPYNFGRDQSLRFNSPRIEYGALCRFLDLMAVSQITVFNTRKDLQQEYAQIYLNKLNINVQEPDDRLYIFRYDAPWNRWLSSIENVLHTRGDNQTTGTNGNEKGNVSFDKQTLLNFEETLFSFRTALHKAPKHEKIYDGADTDAMFNWA